MLGTQAEADDQQSWMQVIGSWARYLGLGTLATTGNPDLQGIGSPAYAAWLRHPGDGR